MAESMWTPDCHTYVCILNISFPMYFSFTVIISSTLLCHAATGLEILVAGKGNLNATAYSKRQPIQLCLSIQLYSLQLSASFALRKTFWWFTWHPSVYVLVRAIHSG